MSAFATIGLMAFSAAGGWALCSLMVVSGEQHAWRRAEEAQAKAARWKALAEHESEEKHRALESLGTTGVSE